MRLTAALLLEMWYSAPDTYAKMWETFCHCSLKACITLALCVILAGTFRAPGDHFLTQCNTGGRNANQPNRSS